MFLTLAKLTLRVLFFSSLPDEYADDAAASVGGVQIGGVYRTGSTLKVSAS